MSKSPVPRVVRPTAGSPINLQMSEALASLARLVLFLGEYIQLPEQEVTEHINIVFQLLESANDAKTKIPS